MTSPKITGIITAGVHGVVRMVAESRAFQRRVGAADDHEARKHIKRWDFRNDEELLHDARPFAAVWPADRYQQTQYAGGEQNWLKGSGGFVLLLTDKDNLPVEQRDESGDDFAAWVDEVVNDLRGLVGRDDHLMVREISLLRPIAHSPDWEKGEDYSYWHVAIVLV
ncbi:MAG TPA: hypothetical protein VMW52_00620 [Phycisphaerae bacterium]|nr:hypothetical protein [Phycisphaerae bacterium]